MSTDYIARPGIKFSDIEHIDLKVGDLHIVVAPSNEAKPGKQCCLTDGENYLWAYSVRGEQPGDVYNKTAFARYGRNDVMDIIGALEERLMSRSFPNMKKSTKTKKTQNETLS